MSEATQRAVEERRTGPRAHHLRTLAKRLEFLVRKKCAPLFEQYPDDPQPLSWVPQSNEAAALRWVLEGCLRECDSPSCINFCRDRMEEWDELVLRQRDRVERDLYGEKQ